MAHARPASGAVKSVTPCGGQPRREVEGGGKRERWVGWGEVAREERGRERKRERQERWKKVDLKLTSQGAGPMDWRSRKGRE